MRARIGNVSVSVSWDWRRFVKVRLAGRLKTMTVGPLAMAVLFWPEHHGA
jgi:hypothetical protein